MKRAAIILGFGIILLAAMSCSNKFLEENEVDLYTINDTVYITSNDENVQVSLQTELDEDYDFTVYMLPRWLSFESMHGKIENGYITFNVNVLHEEVPDYYPVYYSTVYFDVAELGMVSLTVVYTSYRNAAIQYSPSSIIFESASPRELSIVNTGQGLLVWEITSKPDWLTVSLPYDTLYPFEYGAVEIGIKTEMLTSGEYYSGNIMILSNASFSTIQIPVTVVLPVIPPADPGQVTGILTDAEYHQGSGIMAICTKMPNRVHLLNTVTGVMDSIVLDKTPACISFTEDGQKALIGYSVAKVAYIDIASRQITAEYDIDCIPFDIVSGENGWCYITPVEDQWVKLRNLNLTTGEVITSNTASSIYEQTEIRKIPGKPYMAGSQLTVTPSSLLLFDLTGGQAKDAVTRYHESIGRFWLSKDGARLYSAYRNVYTIPDYDGQFHSDSPPVYGNIGSDLQYIWALDECPAISSIFVSSTNYSWQSGTSSLIEQFHTTSLNKIKSFNVSPVWLSTSGTERLYETTPRFIFVNKEGTALYVIKTLQQDFESDNWFMETIEL